MHDVLIIGAGQAGLALGKALKDAGRSFLILTAEEIGAQWKSCYDSLVLFTTRRYSSLPGLPMPGDPDGYASKDEFADYLAAYAQHFELPVERETVTKVLKENGVFTVITDKRTYIAEQVVVATGYRTLYLPPGAEGLHSSQYRNPAQIPPGKVLIVGGGNSGAQIAVELARTHQVSVALKHRVRAISPTYFGRTYSWWQERLRIDRIPTDSLLGPLVARAKDFVVGKELPQALKAGRIIARSAVVRTEGKKVWFADGSTDTFDTIIWATGFRPDHSFLLIPGAREHRRGVSAVPGLYFAGLRNQITNVSGNIYGTHVNTPYLLKHILAYYS